MNGTHCDSSLSLSWNTSHFNYYVAFTTSVIIAAMSPLTVAGNLLVGLAIWRNESLKSPTFFLLGVLSLEYILSGLLFQPSYAATELGNLLTPSSLTEKSFLFYIHLIFGVFGSYITALTILTVTLMAIERWVYMTRQRWMNSNRAWKLFVTLLFLPIPLIVFRTLHILTGAYCYVVHTVGVCILTFCFLTTSLTYLQVFRAIRRHQHQVQASVTSQSSTRQPFVNMTKYKKSVFTILLILALFYLCYLPFALNVILLVFWGISLELIAAFRVSFMLIFVSSMLNPCLYYWRIKQIRHGVKQLLKKMLCKDPIN